MVGAFRKGKIYKRFCKSIAVAKKYSRSKKRKIEKYPGDWEEVMIYKYVSLMSKILKIGRNRKAAVDWLIPITRKNVKSTSRNN